jgi:hypothetical protein
VTTLSDTLRSRAGGPVETASLAAQRAPGERLLDLVGMAGGSR